MGRKVRVSLGTRAPAPTRGRERPRQPKLAGSYAPLFKVLADATRLEILALVAAAPKRLCANEIEAHFQLSQPTISHHLKLLRQVGLLRAEKLGLSVYYAVDHDALAGGLTNFQKAVSK